MATFVQMFVGKMVPWDFCCALPQVATRKNWASAILLVRSDGPAATQGSFPPSDD